MARAWKTHLIASGLVIAGVATGIVMANRAPSREPVGRLNVERVDITIDDKTIARGEPYEVIEPLWNAVDIYGSPADYERTLAPFSSRQRYVLALLWYQAEVNNGGHDQFFFNSTGVVWPDAARAFEEIGLPEGAAIIAEASSRIGGATRERESRQAQLEAHKVNFNDLDDRFYALEASANLERRIMEYIRSSPADFYFHGTVKRAVGNRPE